MRLRTKALISLPALILTVIIVGLAVVATDVGDSRRHGLWLLLQLASDRDVEIDGVVTLSRSIRPTLTVTGLRLPAPAEYEDGDLASIGKAAIQLDLKALFSGHIVLPRVVIEDVAINLEIDPTGENNWRHPTATGDVERDGTLSVPLVETMVLKNVVVHYNNRMVGDQRTFELTSLTKQQREGEDETTIKGSGQLNDRAVRLSGSIASLEVMLTSKERFPINIEAEFPNVDLSVSGSVNPFLSKDALDLSIAANIYSLRAALESIALHSAFDGLAKATGKVTGALESPALSALLLDVAIASGGGIQIAGDVANLANGSGISLAGTVELSRDFPWFVGVIPPELDLSFVSARLEALGRLDDLWLSDIVIEAKDRRAGTIKATGALSMDLFGRNRRLLDGRLSLALALPRSKTLDTWLGAEWGRLGPVSAKAELAVDDDTLKLNNLAIDAQGLGTVIVDAEGTLGAFGAFEFIPTVRPNLSIKASVRKASELFSAFDIAAPDFGPLNAALRLNQTAEGYRLNDIVLSFGQGAGPTVHAEGSMTGTWDDAGPQLQTVAMKIKAGAKSATAALGLDMPDLGPLKFEAAVGNKGNALSIKDIVLDLGESDQLTVTGRGKIDALHLDARPWPLSGIDIALRAATPALSKVSRLAGVALPDLGPAHLAARLRDRKDGVGLDDITLEIGTKGGLFIAGRGTLDKIRFGSTDDTFAGFEMKMSANAATTASLAPMIGFEPPELGALQATARLTDAHEKLRLADLRIDGGTAGRGTVKIEGGIGDLLALREITANGQLTSPLKLFLPLDQSGALGSVTAKLVLSDADGSLGFEIIDIKSIENTLYDMNIKGRIDDLKDRDEIELAAHLTVPDPDALARIFDGTAGGIRRIDFAGSVTGGAERVEAKGDFKVGKTTLSGRIAGSLADGYPKLAGTLTSDLLHLADFGLAFDGSKPPPTPTPTTQPQPATGPVDLFSTDPIPFDALRGMDLDLTVDIDEIEGAAVRVDKATAHVNLQGGKLRVTPLRFDFVGGHTVAQLAVDSTQPVPRIAFTARAKDLNLESVFANLKADVPIGGDLDLKINLSGEGATPQAIADSLDGTVDLAISRGKILLGFFNLTAIDLFSWVLSKEARQGYSDITCLIVRFESEDGVANAKGFLLDTPTVRSAGTGKIDLHKETLDLLFDPEPKHKRIAQFTTPFAVRGPLSEPSVDVDMTSVAARTVGDIVFSPINALGSLLSMVSDDGKDADNPCLQK